MAIEKLGSVASAATSPAIESGKEKFGRVFGQATQRQANPAQASGELKSQVAPPASHVATAGRVTAAHSTPRVQAGHQVIRGVERVEQAQRRLEHILRMAESGKTFTPAELIALQAQVYQASNEIDLAGKVVDKATGGVKQILQTQV